MTPQRSTGPLTRMPRRSGGAASHTVITYGIALVIAMLTLLSAAAPLALPAALAVEDDESRNLSVEIVADPTTPPPTSPPPTETEPPPTETPPPPSGSTPSPGGGSTPGGGTITQEPFSDPSDADNALGDDATDSGGMIYLSGILPRVSPSLHPSGGKVTLVVSVRNISNETVDGTVDFWITTIWGWRISESLGGEVTALAPGETRKITATVSGPGQWAFYQAHAKFTPPETIDGAETPPLEREHFLFVMPYFLIAMLLLLVLGYVGYRIWRRNAASTETSDPAGVNTA